MMLTMKINEENRCLPSRTSRWYACQFLRTCRSSDLDVYQTMSQVYMCEDRGASALTGGGGFSGIDVADNDHVDVHLLLTAKHNWLACVY